MFAAILHKQITLAYRKYVGNDGMKYDMGVVVSLTVIYVTIITRGNCPFGSLIDMNVRICLEYRQKIIEANNCRRSSNYVLVLPLRSTMCLFPKKLAF